ncbi:sulfatase-like hydrolase/transferase [Modicisalibacter coralii]|uniref:sulfatase-like hydrolase/transferase n=1 Tax=Modicisalibacter coralii TaxID=2304602 RepID=UPI00100B9208|nr:sulfatase-like hydrolase/transferase [Halomonas coralii]
MSDPGNLLVILSDEHTAAALGAAVADVQVHTPYLDRLAARGVRFTNAYTPSPICVPARAAFATGRHVHDIRLWDNAMPYVGDPRGWGHALQDKGIRVESIGKLHYRDDEDDTGFDAQHVPMHVANGHGMVFGSIRRLEDRVLQRDTRMLGDYIGPGDSPYTQYDAAVTDLTREWLAARAQEARQDPWCLYVGLVAPHFPLIVPQAFLDLYPEGSLPPIKLHPRDGYQQHPWVHLESLAFVGDEGMRDEAERQMARRVYYALCSYLDHNIGCILDALEATGLDRNTTVIYSSDHGDNVGARGYWGKGNFYEESVTVPLIVAGPRLPRGSVCRTPVSLIDISETIIDHFDAPLAGERPGRSLYRILAEADDPSRGVFSEYHAVGAVSGAFMVRQDGWKLIHYQGFEPELFDLNTDPGEFNDRAHDPACADRLAALYEVLYGICDPAEVDAQAFADQEALIEGYGGREAALQIGSRGATPPPSR